MFKVGDIVRRKTGDAPIEVTCVAPNYIWGTYLRSGIRIKSTPHQDFVYYTESTSIPKEPDMNNTLYHIPSVSETTYATKLAVNSAGRWVMEEKGTSKVFDIDPKDAIEVTPYTVRIRFLNDIGANDFLAKEGELKVGDVTVQHSSSGTWMGVVEAVDTKSKSAKTQFSGRILVTKEVGE